MEKNEIPTASISFARPSRKILKKAEPFDHRYDKIKERPVSYHITTSIDGSFIDDVTEIKNALTNIATIQEELKAFIYVGGGSDMSDDAKEIKTKVDSIDKEVRGLTTNIAVLSERIDQKFINVNGKFDLMDVRFNNIDSTLKEIKETLKESVTTKRWKVTTGISIAGGLISLLSLIALIIKLSTGP
jgi:hypothetical protein